MENVTKFRGTTGKMPTSYKNTEAAEKLPRQRYYNVTLKPESIAAKPKRTWLARRVTIECATDFAARFTPPPATTAHRTDPQERHDHQWFNTRSALCHVTLTNDLTSYLR
jgi:hypothetical protein